MTSIEKVKLQIPRSDGTTSFASVDKEICAQWTNDDGEECSKMVDLCDLVRLNSDYFTSLLSQNAFNTSARFNVAGTIANLLEDEILSQEANVNLEEIGDDDVEELDDDAEELDEEDKNELFIEIKVQYVYVIVRKVDDRRTRKDVVYWGVTCDPHHRWSWHKNINAFFDDTHEFLVVFKVTANSRLFNEYSLLTNALVYEKLIDGYSKNFSPCKKFRAGNGVLQDSHVNEAFAKVTKAQKLDVAHQLNSALENQKHMADVDWFVCDYCNNSFFTNLNKLKAHVNDNHSDLSNTKKHVYKCKRSECSGLTFGTKSKLAKHNLIHNPAPDCVVCNKRITDIKSSLKRHLVNQHNYSKLQAKVASEIKLTKKEQAHLDKSSKIDEEMPSEDEDQDKAVKTKPVKSVAGKRKKVNETKPNVLKKPRKK